MGGGWGCAAHYSLRHTNRHPDPTGRRYLSAPGGTFDRPTNTRPPVSVARFTPLLVFYGVQTESMQPRNTDERFILPVRWHKYNRNSIPQDGTSMVSTLAVHLVCGGIYWTGKRSLSAPVVGFRDNMFVIREQPVVLTHGPADLWPHGTTAPSTRQEEELSQRKHPEDEAGRDNWDQLWQRQGFLWGVKNATWVKESQATTYIICLQEECNQRPRDGQRGQD